MDNEIFIAASQKFEAICNPPDDRKDEKQFQDVIEDCLGGMVENSDKR